MEILDIHDMLYFETADTIELVESVISEPELLISQTLQDKVDTMKRPMESSTEEDANNNFIKPSSKKKNFMKPGKQQRLTQPNLEENDKGNTVSTNVDMDTD